MAPMFETRFLWLVHLLEAFENCSIQLSNDWNNFYETNDHLLPSRADKLSSVFKSEALTFSSASLIWIHSTLTGNVATHRKVFAPFLFIAFDRQPFFRLLYSCVPIFHFFSFRFSIMCRGVFNKTIILLGLAGYEMIITNSALRASLVIYHFISSAPS